MSTRFRKYSADQMGDMADEIYARLKPQVEHEENIGKMILIDVDSGEYEIDSNDIAAGDRLYARLPNPQLFGIRIGYRTAHSFAGRSERTVQ
jgi:hypothetical protein